MIDFIATADWQTHHLALFSINGIRFNLHFVIWVLLLCFFCFWCNSKKERKVALVLTFWQIAYLFVAYSLDMIDYHNVGSGEFDDFVINISSEQERSFGVRPDAMAYAFVDYLTILSLKYLSPRPRRVVDPIISCIVFLIVVHLSVGALNVATGAATMAYDLIWTASYYAIFIVLFITSGKMSDKLGYFRGFSYCSFFVSPESAKRLPP